MCSAPHVTCGARKGMHLRCVHEQGKGLAAKLEAQQPAGEKFTRHPDLLEQLASVLMAPQWDSRREELLFHAYGCPWLQALLKACAGEG